MSFSFKSKKGIDTILYRPCVIFQYNDKSKLNVWYVAECD